MALSRKHQVLALAALLPLLAGPARAALPDPAAAAPPEGTGWWLYDNNRFSEARTAWLAEAAAGSPEAEFGLGVLYDLGQAVQPDGPTACRWYERAGDAGHASAAFNAGVMHDNGRCAAGGVNAAATWYAKAAAGGLGRAQFNMGQLYAAGDGVPHNPELARAWFRAAANNGIPAAVGRGGGPDVPVAGSLVPVQPVSPVQQARVASTAGVPLVWTVQPEPAPVAFYVELLALDPAGPRPVLTRTVDVSATLVTLPPEPARYAWRVSAVSSAARHYVPGPWSAFSTTGPAARPGAAKP